MKLEQKFFIEENKVETISKKDQLQLSDYLQVVDAFSRITYETIYVIDYFKMGFDYVSDNPLFLCGHSAEEFIEMGYEFYEKYVENSDLEMLTTINEYGFQFFEKLPLEERKRYTISYDFKLMNREKPIFVHHQITPIFLTEKGRVWKAICVVSLSNNQKSGNIKFTKQGSEEVWNFDMQNKTWEKSEKANLTERESEILHLSAQNFSISEIAEKMFLSADTIKFHRRKLFEKLGVSNISEALAFATANKLL